MTDIRIRKNDGCEEYVCKGEHLAITGWSKVIGDRYEVYVMCPLCCRKYKFVRRWDERVLEAAV